MLEYPIGKALFLVGAAGQLIAFAWFTTVNTVGKHAEWPHPHDLKRIDELCVRQSIKIPLAFGLMQFVGIMLWGIV